MSQELLRPRSVTELLDVTFMLIRAHFGVYATLAVVSALPLLAMSAVGLALSPDGGTGSESMGLAATLVIAALAIVAWIWFFIAGSSLIFATADAYRGKPVEAGSAFRRAMRAAGDVLGASVAKYVVLIGIVVAAALVGGVLGALQPVLAAIVIFGGIGVAIVMVLRWFVVSAVAALEGITGSDALTRSQKLMRDAGGRALLVLLVTIVLEASLSLAGTFATQLLGRFAGASVLDEIGTSLWLLLYPFANVVETAMYFDQRIRAEGFDLEMMAQQLGPTTGGAGEQGAGSAGSVFGGQPG